MYGKKFTSEQLDKIRKSNQGINSKLTKTQVEDIKIRLVNGESEKELAKEYDVKICTISKISSCKNWKWVREDLNSKLLSRHEDEKEERDNKILDMYLKCCTNTSIAEEVGCDAKTINRVVEINNLKTKSEIIKERNENIIKDYLNLCDLEYILKKYDITRKTYNRVIFKYKQAS